MIVVGFWKNIGSLYFFLQVILYFGFDHLAVVMLPDFVKSKGVILIEKGNFFYNPRFSKAVLTT